MNINLNQSLSRRAFLRGAGVTMALPFLEAMMPRMAVAAQTTVPRRMVCIETNMGILPQFFFLRKRARITWRRLIWSGSRRIGKT